MYDKRKRKPTATNINNDFKNIRINILTISIVVDINRSFRNEA